MFFKDFRKLKTENPKPLNIHTFDGSDSPYHPSVIFNEEGYSGYKYIMSETPFYLSLPADGDNYRDQYECPSIHFSNDGVNWIEEIENPIDNLTEEEKKNRDYFSDPDLVETSDGLEIWYRINRRYGNEHNQDNILLLRKKSKDGIHWGGREIIADLSSNDEKDGLGRIVVSPTLLCNDGKYKMWFVDNIHRRNTELCFSESLDGGHKWSKRIVVQLNGMQIRPWHIHVMKEDVLWLTIYDHNSITLWKGESDTEFNFCKTLLRPSGIIGQFYSHDLYRACLAKIEGGKYRLYFSADDMFKSYIGFMEGNTPESLSIISQDGKNNYFPLHRYLNLMLKTKYAIYKKKVTYYVKRLWPKTKEIIKKNVKN